MSLMKQLSTLAKSKQGKDLVEKAKTIANDPKTREKIDDAREKLSGHVETAKQKMAEKKAKEAAGSGSEPTYGDGHAASSTPQYGEDSPSGNPPAPHSDPIDKATPTYGEEEGDKPLYGDDGPKAA